MYPAAPVSYFFKNYHDIAPHAWFLDNNQIIFVTHSRIILKREIKLKKKI